MTTLVGELVELARGEEPDVAPREFRLDELVRSRPSSGPRDARPSISFRTPLEPSRRHRGARTQSSGQSRTCSTTPASGARPTGRSRSPSATALVEVRDRGPGIAAEDRPLVFDRFYRSAGARGMPGAGLGLAIVKQIADAHGGSVTAGAAAGGGAILRLQFHELVRVASRPL